MTLVVADTSPINYLILLGGIEVLQRLYGFVVIPAEVISELCKSGVPACVQEWEAKPPGWMEIRSASIEDPSLSHLDSGEVAAILIAQSEPEALLLIDEAAGRKAASLRGIANTGTLGILRAAARKGHLDLRSALSRLKGTNFSISQLLIDQLLAEHEGRTLSQRPIG